MMPKGKLLGLLFIFLLNKGIYSQVADSLTLVECYGLVRHNAPQLKQLSLNQQEAVVEQEMLSSTNLPNVSAFGKATYQSDAIAIAASGFAIDLFQYNAGLSIDQKIYDGGMVGVQKDLKAIEGEISSLETEIGLYKLNDLVNKYFFGIISLQKSYEILGLKNELLDEQRKNIDSGVRNGIVLQSSLNRIEAEYTGTQQLLIEVEMNIEKLKSSLQILIGAESTRFNLVEPEFILLNDSINRYELKLFQANRSYIESATKLQEKRYVPKFYAFGQTGYSYPGLNMFENQSDYYYIVGVKMAWQIFDWNHSKKEVQLLNLKKSEIDISQADFERNIDISSKNQSLEILKLKELIALDYKIVKSKEAITKSSSSELKNGAITSVDYLSDLNSELQSRYEMELHKIRLLEAQANLALVNGIVQE